MNQPNSIQFFGLGGFSFRKILLAHGGGNKGLQTVRMNLILKDSNFMKLLVFNHQILKT